jgi:hypothetical protein
MQTTRGGDGSLIHRVRDPECTRRAKGVRNNFLSFCSEFAI